MPSDCSAVDALSQDWRVENNWLCPPVSMVVDAIRHALACCSIGTLIVPVWPSTYLWPLLKPRPCRFASFVADVVSLPKRSDLIIPGSGQKVFYRGKPSVFFGCPKFTMLALRIDFRLGPYFLEYLAGIVLRFPGVMFCCVHFAAIFVNSQVSVISVTSLVQLSVFAAVTGRFCFVACFSICETLKINTARRRTGMVEKLDKSTRFDSNGLFCSRPD